MVPEKVLLLKQEMLNLIQHELCHPESVQLQSEGLVFCFHCQKNVFSFYEYINRPTDDYFRSSQLAQAYAAWSGDEHVPMSFPLVNCEGIHDTVVRNQPLYRVRQSIRFLRAINAPFTAGVTPPLTLEETSQFLPEFLNIMYEHPTAESTHERMALNALMKCMHDILAHREMVNPFEVYFQVLVPYVQKSFATSYTPFHDEAEEPNVGRELGKQLIRSSCIRKLFSRYALPFDVLHVMVACYACSSHLEVVGNWAIDFLVRICKGEFYWKRYEHSPIVQAMQKLVNEELTHKKNSHWYYAIVKPIRDGEVREHYSHLWQPLLELQAYLKKRYTPLPPGQLLDLAFTHLFPGILFPDYPDMLGFTLGYNHLLMTLNRRNGLLPKGTCKKAKLIHDVVERFVNRVREFDGMSGTTLWNLDMVKLFFASDPLFEEEIMQVIQLLVKSEDEE